MSLSEAERHRKLLIILTELIREVSKTVPLVIVYDDAHFMDHESAKLLRHVYTKHPESMHLVLTLRKEKGIEHPPELTELSALSGVQKVELGLFTLRETTLLLATRFGISVAPTNLLHFIQERSGGVPGSMVVLIEHMLTSGTIKINELDGTCKVVKPLDQVNTQIPEYVYAKVTSIMDSLSLPVQIALRIASVCNEAAPLAMVVFVRDILLKKGEAASLHIVEAKERCDAASDPSFLEIRELSSLMHELAALGGNGVVFFDMGSDYVHFVDEAVRMVIYDTILASHQTVIHECAVVWYKKYCPLNKRDHFHYNAILADHLYESKHWVDALEHYELAAEQSLLTGCFQESLVCLNSGLRALEAMDNDTQLSEAETEMRHINLLFFFAQASILNQTLDQAMRTLRAVISRGSKFEEKIRTPFLKRFSTKNNMNWDKKLCSQLILNVATARILLKSLTKAEDQRKKSLKQVQRLSQLSICSHRRTADVQESLYKRVTLKNGLRRISVSLNLPWSSNDGAVKPPRRFIHPTLVVSASRRFSRSIKLAPDN